MKKASNFVQLGSKVFGQTYFNKKIIFGPNYTIHWDTKCVNDYFLYYCSKEILKNPFHQSFLQILFWLIYSNWIQPTPPREKACSQKRGNVANDSQKRGNVANVRSNRDKTNTT